MEERLYEELLIEKKFLEKERAKLHKALAYCPRGTLRVSMNRGKYPEYYLHDLDIQNAPKRGIYLTKDQLPLAQKIAQKEYDEMTLETVEKRLALVDEMITCYRISLRMKYDDMSEARKRLVKPIIPKEEEFIQTWRESMVSNANPYNMTNSFLTEKGEAVRSKTEKIIADMLNSKGIPYLYEPMMKIDAGTVIYPDFAILNLRTRKTFFYEHFGMMDDEEYCEKALLKINRYERNGYWFGKNLLYSFETKNSPMDGGLIEKMIEMYAR